MLTLHGRAAHLGGWGRGALNIPPLSFPTASSPKARVSNYTQGAVVIASNNPQAGILIIPSKLPLQISMPKHHLLRPDPHFGATIIFLPVGPIVFWGRAS